MSEEMSLEEQLRRLGEQLGDETNDISLATRLVQTYSGISPNIKWVNYSTQKSMRYLKQQFSDDEQAAEQLLSLIGILGGNLRNPLQYDIEYFAERVMPFIKNDRVAMDDFIQVLKKYSMNEPLNIMRLTMQTLPFIADGLVSVKSLNKLVDAYKRVYSGGIDILDAVVCSFYLAKEADLAIDQITEIVGAYSFGKEKDLVFKAVLDTFQSITGKSLNKCCLVFLSGNQIYIYNEDTKKPVKIPSKRYDKTVSRISITDLFAGNKELSCHEPRGIYYFFQGKYRGYFTGSPRKKSIDKNLCYALVLDNQHITAGEIMAARNDEVVGIYFSHSRLYDAGKYGVYDSFSNQQIFSGAVTAMTSATGFVARRLLLRAENG